MLSSEKAHKQVITVEKSMHLIFHSSTGPLLTISFAPDSGASDGRFRRESIILMAAHKSMDQLENLGGERQTKNDKSKVCCRSPEGSYQQCPRG